MDAKRSDGATVTLPNDNEILITRRFKAPRRAVFEAWSKAEAVRQWYACASFTMPVCEMDFREGGKWRWVQRDPSGTDHPLSGEYREIVRPSRIVYSSRYEPVPGSDHTVELTFEDDGAGTLLTQRFIHGSKTARDGHLKSGMENGVEDAFKRIEALLSSADRAISSSPAPSA